jgi:hypothetical protein
MPRQNYKTKRLVCPKCSRSIAVKQDGTLRGHGFRIGDYGASWCLGSGEKVDPDR